MEPSFRAEGLKFMRAHLTPADENTLLENTLLEMEAAIWKKCTTTKIEELLQFRYRSEVREAVYEDRSPTQSPTPPEVRRKTSGSTIPDCETCGKNDRVTFELVQRRSADEGMTPEFACSRCTTFWH